ncbi:Uncharacterized protein QTN25_008487 [Entamoeba marina]
MFALFVLVVIASADTITVSYARDDNDDYWAFYIAEIGKCYITSVDTESSKKFEKSGDNYVQYYYDSLNCTGTEYGPTTVSDYKLGEMDSSYSYFSDDSTCSYSKDDKYDVAKIYLTTQCSLIDGISFLYETDDGKLKITSYSTNDCSGSGVEVEEECDTCNNGLYVFCGSTINTIMVTALAILFILF